MHFFCIADKGSSLGFKLSGVETREVSTKPETLEALKVAMSSEDIGVLIVTDKAAEFARDELSNYVYENRLPLVLELPSKGSTRKKESSLEFLKQAIGLTI